MALAQDIMKGGLSAGTSHAINGTIAQTVSAAGTTQGTATPLTASINVVTTVAASAGVILYLMRGADDQLVYNAGLNTLTVYPPLGLQINAGATNAGVSLAINTACRFTRVSSTRMIAELSA